MREFDDDDDEDEDDGTGITLDQALLLEIGCTYGEDEMLLVDEDEVNEFHKKILAAEAAAGGDENNEDHQHQQQTQHENQD